MVPIVIIYHENISIDILFVTLSCVFSTVLNTTDHSIMAALIRLQTNVSKVVVVTSQLDFISGPLR